MIQKLWHWVVNFGVSENHSEENELIRIYNGMSVVSTIGASINLLYAYLIGFLEIYILANSLILILYIGVLFLNYFGKIFLARYYVAIGAALWIGGANLFIGGNFCQGMGIMASMTIVYVAFQQKPKVRVVLLTLFALSYLASTIYVSTYQPILGVIDFPYDEISVFIGSLAWIVAVLYKSDRDQSVLLENLRIKNEELHDTTEELERFTYIASHDLKSPLRNIISFIGLIERNIKKQDYSGIQEDLSFVKTGAEQMHFLVTDILELSKLKNDEISVRTLIDLNLVLERATRNLKEELEECGAALYCEKLPSIIGNELEFVLMFQNFIQNGIKYNESDQPTISVSAVESANEVRIAFQDNGIGIEPEYHEQIFKFFKRLHNSTKYRGTGLGLGLCKRIINNYQGDIEVVSKMGEGSTFTIVLPIVTRKEKSVYAIDAKLN